MPLFERFLLDALGAAVASATVDLLDRNTTTPVRATTTTDVNGFFSINHATEGRFDVRITSGSDVIWIKYDTSAQMTELEVTTLKIRNPADTFAYDILPAAITAAQTLTLPLITATDTLAVLGLAQAFTTRQLWSKGADLASGATITPGTDGNYFDITGTTGITAIATLQAGSVVTFQFDGILTITHNATSLILQGSTDLTTAAGDVVSFVSEGGSNWRELSRRLAAAGASGPSQSTQAALEAETNEDTYAPPDLIKHSPGVAKAWCSITSAGALESPDHNISTIGDLGTGNRDVNFTVAMSGSTYVVQVSLTLSSNNASTDWLARTTADVDVRGHNGSGSLEDGAHTMTIHGDQ